MHIVVTQHATTTEISAIVTDDEIWSMPPVILSAYLSGCKGNMLFAAAFLGLMLDKDITHFKEEHHGTLTS